MLMLRFIVALLFTTVLVVAALLIGLLVLPTAPILWIILSVACGIFMLGLIVINILFEARRRKRLQGMNEKERFDYSMQLKEEIEGDYYAAERNVFAAIVCGKLYIAVFILLCMLGIMFLGALRSESTGIMVVYGILMMGLIVRLTKKNDKVVPAYILTEQEYPLLYAVARRAQKTVGCEGEISFFLNDSLSVFETRERIYIGIGAVLYALLTHEELYAALLHEFAHVQNRDTRRSLQFFRARNLWLREESLGSSLIISAISLHINLKMRQYEVISSQYHEILADEIVRKCGKGQLFIDAVSKGEELDVYYGMFRRETFFDCYESKNPVTDYESREFAAFLKYREKFGDIWHKILTKRLPAMFDSHPSLRQRMTALDISSYNDSRVEENTEVCNEQKKLLSFADYLEFESMQGNYDNIRKEQYLKPKALMEEYLEAESKGETLPALKLCDYSHAFYGIDNERAFKISDEEIEKNCYAAVGHFTKAKIFYHQMDERCLNEFRKAMQLKPVLYEDCLEYMGYFVQRTGNEELIRQYRNDSVVLAQEAIERINAQNWHREKPPLRKCELPEVILNTLRERINAYSNFVRCVYAADFGEKEVCTMIAVDTNVQVKTERWNEIFEWLEEYLDSLPEPFMLCDLSGKDIAPAVSAANIQPIYRQNK